MNGELIEKIINTQWKNRNTGFFADYDRIPEAAQQQAYQERQARLMELYTNILRCVSDAYGVEGRHSAPNYSLIEFRGKIFRIEEIDND